jgi:ABC-type Fe3+-siderophore transport system permease subunit
MIPTLYNATNQTIEGALTVVTTASGTSPDILYLAPALVIIGFFCLFLYMAETRRDVGYAMFMMALSGLAFNDTLLSSIKYTITVGGQSANLPLLMVFTSCYEVVMILLLMNELNQRKKEGGSDGG